VGLVQNRKTISFQNLTTLDLGYCVEGSDDEDGNESFVESSIMYIYTRNLKACDQRNLISIFHGTLFLWDEFPGPSKVHGHGPLP
jgi:hypothetical protein